MARVWTPSALGLALETLKRHTRVEDAVAELRCSYDGLKYALSAAGLPTARHFLKGKSALIQHGQRRVLVIPDMHIPYHDAVAWKVMLAAVIALKPDTVVIIGDFADCFEISDFAKPADRPFTFKEEMGIVGDRLTELDEACREVGVTAKLYFLGNHEYRLSRYIAKNAPALHGLVDIESLLKLKERGWQVIPYGEDFTIGKVHFSHEFGRCGKYATQQALVDMGHCVVFGHVHTASIAYGGFVTGERHVAMAVGWGGDYEALAFSYKRKALAKKDWIHGFGWCDIDAAGNGWLTFVPILDGKARCEGTLIEGDYQ